MSIEAGREIGHYRIVSKIGEGGMGEVFLADDLKLERRVAIKFLHREFLGNPDKLSRFKREAKSASALNHPHILTVYEIGETDGLEYIVTEWIDGKTVRQLIRERDSLSLHKVLIIGSQVADALAAAHDAGIIHRDVKPDNIMVRKDGLAKVLDFGLVKLRQDHDVIMSEADTREHHKTRSGIVVGTAAYMSPEQARGKQIDGRSDMFSFGTVMYELLTGVHPFPGESNADAVSSILRVEPTPILQLRPELPKELERIIEKLLRKDKEYRYQDIKDLRLDLDDLRDELRLESKHSSSKGVDTNLVGNSTSETRVRPSLTSTIVEKRRFSVLHALIFTAVAVTLFAGVWFTLPKFYAPPREPGSYPTSEIASWSSAAGELFTEARFSPDGRLIAYSSTRSGTPDVWVTQTTSSNPIQVTNDAFSNSDPVWSPKGDEIAYFSDRSRSESGGVRSKGIWRVPSFGGVPKFVGEITAGTPKLRLWGPSGKIYFQLAGNLYALDLNTGNSEQITSFAPDSSLWVGISQDEAKIARVVKDKDDWTITVADRQGGEPVIVAAGNGEFSHVAWSSAADRMYFGANAGDVMQVFVSRGSPDSVSRITAAESDVSVADVSPDGRSIIVSSAKEEVNLWRVSLSKDGKETPIVRDLDVKLWPSVSPDGRYIVYQATRTLTKGNHLYTGNITVKEIEAPGDAGRPRMIAENGFLPVWSPNGSQIAFLRQSDAKLELFVADPNAGVAPRPLAKGIPPLGFSVTPYNLSHARAVSWSPDSSTIAYASEKNGAYNIWTVNAVTGREQLATDNTDGRTTYYCPFWSKDGTKLAFLFQTKGAEQGQRTKRGIRILEPSSGQNQQVYESLESIRILGWRADGTGLLIAEGASEFVGQAQSVIIRSVTIAGGSSEIVRLPNAYYFNTFLSYDGTTLAFAARNNDLDDLWTVPVSGGTPKKITANNDSEVYFSRFGWLHDGSGLVFGKQTRFSLLWFVSEID